MKIITFEQLKPAKGIPFTRVHLARLCEAGKFPKPFPISEGRIGWDEAEIDAHLERLRDTHRSGEAA